MKYYIDEPDLGTDDLRPLVGITAKTVFYKTREEAEAEADRIQEISDIFFMVVEVEE